MTMHLVGPALSMNSTRKRKTKGLTARDRQAQADYALYLKSLGVTPKKRNIRKDYTAFADTNTFNNPRQTVSHPYYSAPSSEPGTAMQKRDDRDRLAVSSQYSIAPAYNKGPYMVIAREDLKTAGKKV